MTKFATAALALASILASATASGTVCGWKYNWGTTCYSLVTDGTTDGNECASTSGWHTTREACCEAHINEHDDEGYTACVTGSTHDGTGGTAPTGTSRYYLDYSRDPDSCSADCPVDSANPACGGVLHPGSNKNTYTTAADCCAGELNWMNEDYCAALSDGATYIGSGGFYVESSEHICVKDCDGAAPCGGIMTQSGVTVYNDSTNSGTQRDEDNIADCCAALPWIDPAICATQSNPAVDGTNKWFIEGSICRKDCNGGTGQECSSASRYTKLFDDVDACCNALGWLDDDYCKSRSDPSTSYNGAQAGSTDKWYVVWGKSACAQDCDTSNPACDLLEANAVLHATAAACCSAHLGSVDATDCETASTTGVAASDIDPTGTGKWYADYSTTPALCVTDCPESSGTPCGGVAPRNAGVTLYDDPATCCSGKFGWYQQDLCEVLSANAGNGHTQLWYADQGAGVCMQDCDTAGAASCGGNPTDFSQPMFADATACCKAKLGWINENTCVAKSTTGANAPTVGTDKWFVNWQTNMCDKDCADGTGAGCRGIHDGTNVVMHEDPEACCAAHFSWIDKEFCASRSQGAAYSGRFYPNQGEGKCYEDCDPNQDAICKGPPTDLGVPMYADPETCCTSSVGWADKDICAGASLASLATDEYWINWTYNKCVKNCPEDSGDAACGGIAKSWNIKYASANSCCSQPAFNNVERADCVKA